MKLLALLLCLLFLETGLSLIIELKTLTRFKKQFGAGPAPDGIRGSWTSAGLVTLVAGAVACLAMGLAKMGVLGPVLSPVNWGCAAVLLLMVYFLGLSTYYLYKRWRFSRLMRK